MLTLKIDRDDDECGDCPFKDSFHDGDRGMCTLFKETLQPVLDSGVVQGYYPCVSCNLAYQHLKREEYVEDY